MLHIAFQGYLPPERRQDKHHRDVRESERSLEGNMQWRGRVQNPEATGREQGLPLHFLLWKPVSAGKYFSGIWTAPHARRFPSPAAAQAMERLRFCRRQRSEGGMPLSAWAPTQDQAVAPGTPFSGLMRTGYPQTSATGMCPPGSVPEKGVPGVTAGLRKESPTFATNSCPPRPVMIDRKEPER